MELTQREDIIKFIIKIQLNFENAYVTTTQLERELLVKAGTKRLELCRKQFAQPQ